MNYFQISNDLQRLLLGMERTEKICVESDFGYINGDQDRVRVRFTWCGLDKVLNIFSVLEGNLLSCSQSIDRQQFSELRHHEDCAHKENGTFNMELTAILDIRTLALNQVGYLGSGFMHLVLEVSGSGGVFVPPLATMLNQLWQYKRASTGDWTQDPWFSIHENIQDQCSTTEL